MPRPPDASASRTSTRAGFDASSPRWSWCLRPATPQVGSGCSRIASPSSASTWPVEPASRRISSFGRRRATSTQAARPSRCCTSGPSASKSSSTWRGRLWCISPGAPARRPGRGSRCGDVVAGVESLLHPAGSGGDVLLSSHPRLGTDGRERARLPRPAGDAGRLAQSAASFDRLLAHQNQRDLMSIAGLVAVAGATMGLDGARHYPGAWAVIPVAGAALLIAAGPAAIVNRAALAATPMVWVGLISYPLYLWHWPLLAFARLWQAGEPSVPQRVVAVVLAFALAAITYRALERPPFALAGGGVASCRRCRWQWRCCCLPGGRPTAATGSPCGPST